MALPYVEISVDPPVISAREHEDGKGEVVTISQGGREWSITTSGDFPCPVEVRRWPDAEPEIRRVGSEDELLKLVQDVCLDILKTAEIHFGTPKAE